MSSPLLLLIFVLQELFELLRVLHVGTAVCLGVERAQPRPPAHLKAQTKTWKQEVGFQTIKVWSFKVNPKLSLGKATTQTRRGEHRQVIHTQRLLPLVGGILKTTSACPPAKNSPLWDPSAGIRVVLAQEWAAGPKQKVLQIHENGFFSLRELSSY